MTLFDACRAHLAARGDATPLLPALRGGTCRDTDLHARIDAAREAGDQDAVDLGEALLGVSFSERRRIVKALRR